MAAAVRAAESGVRVGIVDENVAPGGQIWRGGSSEGSHSSEASNWLVRLKKAGVIELCGKRVFHHPEAGVLLAEGLDDVWELSYRQSGVGNGSAGKISAISRLDVAERDGRRRIAGDGEVRSADSRQAGRRRRHRAASAGSCVLSAQAWRGDTADLRAGILEQAGAIRHGADPPSGKDRPGFAAEERHRGHSVRLRAVGPSRLTENERSKR